MKVFSGVAMTACRLLHRLGCSDCLNYLFCTLWVELYMLMFNICTVWLQALLHSYFGGRGLRETAMMEQNLCCRGRFFLPGTWSSGPSSVAAAVSAACSYGVMFVHTCVLLSLAACRPCCSC